MVSTADSPSVPHVRELLADFKATGDQHAFEEIVRRYAGMVFGVCLRTTKNAHDAEDATQAVFLSLAVQCKTGDGVKYVGPWLQQVAKRVSLDIKRSRKRRETRELRHHAMNGNGNGHTEVERAVAVDVDDLKGVLGEELNQLPSKYRLPLILHYFGGMTRDEMARELNCKPATLGVRIHRGREMLGRRLHERGAAPPGLMLSAVLTGWIHQAISDNLVARTIDSACRMGGGPDLGATIASNVLALSKSAAAGASLAAKLKMVAAVLVVASMTGVAGGAVAKLAPAIDIQLPEILKFNWVPKFRSPLSVPQVNAGPSGAQQAPGTAKVAQAGESDRRTEVAVATPGVAPVSVAQGRAAAAPPRPPTVRVSGDVPAVPRGPEQTNAAAVATGEPAIASDAPAAGRPVLPAAAVAHAGSIGRAAISENTAGPADPVAAPLPEGTTAAGDVEVATVDAVSGITDGAEGTSVSLPRATMLSVGGAGGGSGSFNINGGHAAYDVQVVGGAGDGVVNHRGGSNTFSQLRIGRDYGSRGVYHAKGGAALRVKRGRLPEEVAGIEVGGRGDGTLLVGDADSTANVSAVGDIVPGVAEPSLVVRGDPLGSGRIEGHATINLGGTLENNGQVVANGYGRGRTLDIDGFRQVVNAIENPPVGGTHGWFARDGARLALPRVRIRAGTDTYTWGESATDDTIDLVNSARVTLHDVPADGFLDVSLVAPDRGGVPPLPKGHTFIGIWEMSTFGFSRDPDTGALASLPLSPSGVDLVVRYDDGLAAELGLDEGQLKLWKYQDGRWMRVLDGFERNPDLNLLTGHTDGAIGYFAVSAPEPGAISLLVLGAGALLARRPRRG